MLNAHTDVRCPATGSRVQCAGPRWRRSPGSSLGPGSRPGSQKMYSGRAGSCPLKQVDDPYALDWDAVKTLDKAALPARLVPADLADVEILALHEFALSKAHRSAMVIVEACRRLVLGLGPQRSRGDICPASGSSAARVPPRLGGRHGHDGGVRGGGPGRPAPCGGRIRPHPDGLEVRPAGHRPLAGRRSQVGPPWPACPTGDRGDALAASAQPHY